MKASSIKSMRTLKEIWLEVHVENVAAESLDRIVKRQNMHSFSIFDVQALVHIDDIAELHAQVVSSDLVELDATFLDIIRTQTNKHGIFPLLPTVAK